MKKLFALTGVALIAILFTVCANPFWPDIDFGDKKNADPQVPIIEVQPNIASAPNGVMYYQDADVVHELWVKASVIDGGHLTYQWYFFPENSPGSVTTISGATGFAYLPSVSDIGEFNYYVVVTNNLNGKTATARSNNAKVKVTTKQLIALPWILDVDINVTAPVKGETVSHTVTGFNSDEVEVANVVWSSSSGVINPPDVFLASTVYTVSVTLHAKGASEFAPTHYLLSPTINGIVIGMENLYEPDNQTLILTLTFSATLAKGVIDIAIKSPPDKMTYEHDEELSLNGMIVTLKYDDLTEEDLPFINFGTYITPIPAHGSVLSRPAHNNQPISVSYGGSFAKNTGNLTVNPARIMSVNLTISVPTTGGTPATTAGGWYGNNFTSGTVTWTPTPPDGKFLGSTPYKATVTLTADTNYTFTGGLTTARINGMPAEVTSNVGSTVVFSFDFSATSEKTVTGIEIETPPNLEYDHGASLNLTALKIRVNYNDGTHDILNYDSTGVTINYANNITLSRGTHNNQNIQVTYSGQTVDTDPLTVNVAKIPSAVITDVTPPDVGEEPDTTAKTDTPNITMSAVTWTPNDNPFVTSGVYTATVTLTANEHYEFTLPSFTATIDGVNAGVSELTAKTVKVYRTFSAIGEVFVTGITITAEPTLTYTHGDTLKLAALRATVNFSDGSSKTNQDYLDLAEDLINITPSHGALLTHLGHHSTSITISRHTGSANRNLTVNKKALTIESASHSKTYDGNTNTPGLTVVLSGVISADAAQNVLPSVITAAYTSPNADTNTVNISAVTLTSTGNTWDNYTVTPRNGVTITTPIAKRSVTITPDSGQSKAFGASDPVLTFTSSETMIVAAGNTQTGNLSRNSGSNVGPYAITLGNLSWGNNYVLYLSAGTVNFNIVKAPGASMSAVALASTNNSIIINSASLVPNGEQTVIQYAYNTTGDTPTSWTDIGILPVTIGSLASGTEYFVFTRSKESDNYLAGGHRQDIKWTQAELSNITIAFDPDANPADALTFSSGSIDNIIIRYGSSDSLTITLPSAGFTDIKWYLNEDHVPAKDNDLSYTLLGTDFTRFDERVNYLYVEVNGGLYSKTIPFKVVP